MSIIFLNFQTRERINESEYSKKIQKVIKQKEDSIGLIARVMNEGLLKLGYTPKFLDTNVYDHLANRFGNEPPRGGVVYKSPCEYDKHHDVLYIDTYGRGSAHCSTHDFFYVNRDVRTYNKPMPLPSDIVKIITALKKHPTATVVLGKKSDPFMWMDIKYSITKEVLNYLKENGRTVNIFTRSDLVGHNDYIELLPSETTTSMFLPGHMNSGLARIEEPGAPSPERRKIAVERIRESGGRVRIIFTEVLTKLNQTKKRVKNG